VGAKGSAQFPLEKLIPYELISKSVKFRVKENLKKVETKGKKKKVSLESTKGRLQYEDTLHYHSLAQNRLFKMRLDKALTSSEIPAICRPALQARLWL
jgi:uncharacterized protein YdaL